jgi:predicted transcriptional regulator
MSDQPKSYTYTQAIGYLYKILKIIDIVGVINATPLMFIISKTSSSAFRKRLANLLEHGYIEIHPSNNRGTYYTLTSSGKEALRKIEDVIPILTKMDPLFDFDKIELGSLSNKNDQNFIRMVTTKNKKLG